MLRGAMSARRALRLGACLGLATSSVSALSLSQPKQLKITYFNIQGPAEPARLALVIGGVAFEDERLNRDEMMALREAGKLPWGQLPLCTVDGSTVFAQSPAIATYCAKLAGLYPEDPIAAARVDEIVNFINQDVRERCIAPRCDPSCSLVAARRACARSASSLTRSPSANKGTRAPRAATSSGNPRTDPGARPTRSSPKRFPRAATAGW